MPHKFMKSIVGASILVVTTTIAAHSADRCNIRFTFDNQFTETVQVRRGKHIYIEGDRGNYFENLDRTRSIPAGQRRTTRKNRLQKVNDNTDATFRLQIFLPFLFEVRQQIPTVEELMGLRKVNHRCRDSDTAVVFTMRYLTDTPENRAAIDRAVLGARVRRPGMTLDAARTLLFQRYMGIAL